MIGQFMAEDVGEIQHRSRLVRAGDVRGTALDDGFAADGIAGVDCSSDTMFVRHAF